MARSLKQLIETVEELGLRDIGLHSITEAIDNGTSGGKLIFHVFGALAEFERSVIRECTRAGLNAARVRGRPAVLKDDDLAEARALLRDPGITVAHIAKRLSCGGVNALSLSARRARRSGRSGMKDGADGLIIGSM